MRKIVFASLALVMSLTASAKDYKYTVVKGDPMQTRIYTLDNGLRVYLSVNSEKPRVTAHIAVNTGSHNDPADCTGLSHYLEHLMFKGTTQFGTTDYSKEKPLLDQITARYEEYRRLTDAGARREKYHEIDSLSQLAAAYNIPNEYDKLMALIGSNNSNAYTSYDVTCYTEDVPSNEVERWARIQSDRFRNLVIRGFHTELEAVYEEKNISLTNDSEKQIDALFSHLYPTHSYGTQTVIGTQDHLKNPSIVEIMRYYNRYYVPNNVAICMAGDMDPDKVIAVIDREFGSWKAGADTAPRQFAPLAPLTQPVEATVVGPQQKSVMIGWRFKGEGSMQHDTLEVLSNVLTNERCGLIDVDVNQKALTLSATSGTYGLKDYSSLLLLATPKEGQTLAEAKQILLDEVKKLKAGDFDEGLLKASINNLKRNQLQELEDNRSRVSEMVDAFINGETWADHVGRIDRMSRITKADIVAFARQYLTDGYVAVYKETGVDSTVKKIDKPAITPIPTNRDYKSKFVAEVEAGHMPPIEPVFVDYKKELTFTTTKHRLPVVYKRNTENQLFGLTYMWEFGQQADNRYRTAADYARLLGTSKMSLEELQKKFYSLACNYSINVSDEVISISLEGLHENMAEAVGLLEQAFADLKPDAGQYRKYVSNTLNARELQKTDQRTCFNALVEYGMHGKRNAQTNVMSASELNATSPATLTGLLKGLNAMAHTVYYYGPASESELCRIIDANHKTAKRLAAVPENKPYEWVNTPKSEVIIAPYDAKNIYMRMFATEGRQLDIDRLPMIRTFNEYFGGGMNTIVFQELREARALAYTANANYVAPSRKGQPEYTSMLIISQNDKLMDCVNAFREITDNMPENESAFATAKQNLMKSIAAQRTTKQGIIRSYIAAKRRGIDYDVNRNVYNQVQQMTMSDVARFMKDNIAGHPLRYLILGNESELDIKSLEKVAPVRRVSLEEIFGY
ncbi:MAG: insulinase family protein [Bacteroidaceae bacterium]|nr:insulinase family protein [Bacteroidaceae bacterium]